MIDESGAISTEQDLDEILTRPRPVLIEFMQNIRSPLIILGAGGRMGPTLALLARRAAKAAGRELEIVAASRFSNPDARRWLDEHGMRTVSLDLFDRASYNGLPDSENVIFLVGLKFGATQNPVQTWATNTLIPSFTCERYPAARISVVSSGNVYPPVPSGGEGSRETDPLTPLGEYANSCVARERIFDFFSSRNGALVALVRLSYALDLRYGILADIAQRIYRDEPVDTTMGSFQCIWQGDANEMILRSLQLARSPAYAVNLTGPAPLTVREVGEQFAQLMGKKPMFYGQESGMALLSSTRRMVQALGAPPMPLDQVIRWTAGWVMSGGRTYNRPLHIHARDAKE